MGNAHDQGLAGGVGRSIGGFRPVPPPPAGSGGVGAAAGSDSGGSMGRIMAPTRGLERQLA